jgi:hypothetical protein
VTVRAAYFFDPNTGDDMVDKDDLFQEEDGIDPQDHDRDEPSSDEDDDIIDLFDTVEIPADIIEEDIIELTDMIEASDDDTIELTDEAHATVIDDDVLDLTETVDVDEAEQEDDVLNLTDIADTAAEEEEAQDEILDLKETVSGDDTSQAGMDQTESVEPVEPVQEEFSVETATMPSVGYEEDKELLELIDDIQATLDDEPVASHIDDREDTAEEDEAIDTDTRDEDAETYTLLDDDDLADSDGIPESETEFVDHLGIDLTSEIERKALEENQDAAMEEVRPSEGMEPTMAPGSLETAVKQALTEMLADENNPLTRAIENAVKKALGQGENT